MIPRHEHTFAKFSDNPAPGPISANVLDDLFRAVQGAHAAGLPLPPLPPCQQVTEAQHHQTTARDRSRPWHRGSQFPGAGDFRKINTYDRFRIWKAAEGFERRTHTKGKHGGALGHTGMAVLHSMLFDFVNMGCV